MKYFCSDKKNWQYNTISNNGNKWFNYIEGYKMISEYIEKEILENDRSYQDFLLFPYCFSIRHYIEISLKEIIENGSKRIGEDVITSHSLLLLLNKLTPILDKLGMGETPQNVQNFINELHGIDSKSDNFRYPIDTKGNPTLENIDSINFKRVSDGFKEVKNYFEFVSASIENNEAMKT